MSTWQFAIAILFSMVFNDVFCNQCPNSSYASNKIYTYTHTLNSFDTLNLVGTSSDPATLDYFYVVNTVNITAGNYRMFVQRNENTTMKYQVHYNGNVVANSVTFSQDSSILYFILGSDTQLNLMSINLTDGSVINSIGYTDLMGNTSYCRIILTNSTEQVYVTNQEISTGKANFCKVNLTSPYNYQ